jgi:NAD(P)-dependent dehydrogenase (short-subunit alcohol dehydrogenase family)
MACDAAKTADGLEMQLGTNHVGHHLLATRLLPLLERSGSPADPARVVVLSSIGHRLYGIRPDGLNLDDLAYEARGGGAGCSDASAAAVLARRAGHARARRGPVSLCKNLESLRNDICPPFRDALRRQGVTLTV